MSVDFVSEKKKQKYLIILFLIIVAISFLILWFGYLKEKGPVSVPVSMFVHNPYCPEIKIDFSVLRSASLKDLQPFEEFVPFQGEKGRDNPFLPYSTPEPLEETQK